ncbi:MAG: phosphatidate cytidylyltransferase [Clostridiales bacterium]|nr:phosphatidate cytidylyltransferase [Clostridiales bacterium]
MVKRIVSAVIGIPFFLFFVYLGGIFFAGLVLLLSLLAMVELDRMLKRMGIKNMQSFLYTGALLFPLLFYFDPTWLASFLVLFVVSGTIISLSHYPESGFSDLSANFFSIFYIAFGFAHLLLLRQMEQGMLLVAYCFSVIWMNDIGSYCVGTYLGKRPFFNYISPNKTVEGAVGGLLAGVAGGLLFCVLINRVMTMDNMGFLIFLTPFLCVAGQAGDLFESTLKRKARIKDSSQLIPGHGGILDRFDSALWVAPLLYHILQIRMNIFS